MKNNSKTDRRRLLNLSMRVIVALVMVGLLVIPIAVQADLKATAVVYAWDITASKFQNSNVIIAWDGTWVPFLHELNFDKDLWPVEPSDACPLGGTTKWAGNMYYGLYHVDNAPLNAPGFQESRKWSLISCDRNDDGSWSNVDLYDPQLPYDRREVYAECDEFGDTCYVDAAEQDVVTGCTTGNCLSEIVTTIRVNLDLNCDGAVDQALLDKGLTVDNNGNPEALCFYAEAKTPSLEDVLAGGEWGLPLQARISTVGGEKTVSFALAPTAVELAAFDARAQENGVLLTWETASEIDNVGFNIYRAASLAGQEIKLNPHLIASHNPGGVAGAAYAFLDESAAAGVTYTYWLEDIDASGAATRHGPVAAKVAAARTLPGRPRPAPR